MIVYMRAVIGAIAGAILMSVLPVTHSQAQSAKPGDAVKGQKIFTLQKCTTCHGVNDKAKKFGPDLGAIGSKRDAAWLAKYLVNPTPLDPKNPPIVKMTPVNVKGADLDNLVAYLLTLKARQ